MSSGTADTSTRAGDITKFTIGNSPDFSAVVQTVSYYEDILEPSIKVNVNIMEAGWIGLRNVMVMTLPQ